MQLCQLTREDKKEIVRGIIVATRSMFDFTENYPEENSDESKCFATRLNFRTNNIVVVEDGEFWIGLWCGDPILIRNDGFALFPRWLAEVLSEPECGGFSIEESNFVDEK